MGKHNIFQIAFIGAFMTIALIAVFVLATGTGSDSDGGGTVTIWGTVDQNVIDDILRFNQESFEPYSVTYLEIPEARFDNELVEAIAEGRGPDAIFLPSESIIRHELKLAPIPFSSYSERRYLDTFIEGGETFLTDAGALAIPFSVDPIVMYWNRDIFSNAGLSQPPRYWDELPQVVQRVTETDEARNVLTSAIPFGEYRNVTNAKEILSTLLLQSGVTITERPVGESTGYEVTLGLRQNDNQIQPSDAVLNFYTEYSNPVNSVYTWNRALPSSRQAFLGNDLGMYLGYASERAELRAANPNLNFDVASVPQIRDTTDQATFGRVQGLAVLRSSRNTTAAYNVIFLLTSPAIALEFTEYSGLPPVQRALLSEPQTGAIQNVFYRSALISKNWLDPDPQASEIVLQDLVENITAGRYGVRESIGRAKDELEAIQ